MCAFSLSQICYETRPCSEHEERGAAVSVWPEEGPRLIEQELEGEVRAGKEQLLPVRRRIENGADEKAGLLGRPYC